MGQSTIAREQLRSIVERIERLEEEKKAIADDIRDVYTEAKGNGFDAKVIRQCVKLRKMESHERQEQEAILDLYKHALGLSPQEIADGGHSSATAIEKPRKNAQLVEAHRIIVENNKVSYALLKSRMGVDAPVAGKLIQQLETLGVVSKADDQMNRSILITDLDFCREKELLDQ